MYAESARAAAANRRCLSASGFAEPLHDRQLVEPRQVLRGRAELAETRAGGAHVAQRLVELAPLTRQVGVAERLARGIINLAMAALAGLRIRCLRVVADQPVAQPAERNESFQRTGRVRPL